MQENSEPAKLAKGGPLVVKRILSSRDRDQSLAFTCSYVGRLDVEVIRRPELAVILRKDAGPKEKFVSQRTMTSELARPVVSILPCLHKKTKAFYSEI